ncbi:DUF4365 domain-containing protein [Kibdelosporangium lantanae]|uniref:DUF4365 domain-containing protein n=1 Tax=Kibdelosporangium lantanae TaxID=1497396 RepID=A0ABW3M1A6_9PSEU
MARRKPSARIASVGVARTRLAVESELEWLFREQLNEDYGVDAQVEVVDGGTVRGKLLALQIKSGVSFFREPGPGGWWFRADADHVHYWMNHSLPVVVVLYHPDTERCHWQLVNTKTLVATSSGGWKLLVPQVQVLDKEARAPLREAAKGHRVIIRIREPQLPNREDLSGSLSGESRQASDDGSLPKSELGQPPIGNFDITPSPRLLDSLTRVIAAPWMCVAEMIDTAYNSTCEAGSESPALTVSVTIPSMTGKTNNELVVRDNGVGMAPESLLTAIRGSFTGTGDWHGRGFNLAMMATRLGHLITIRTSQTGDPSWIELSYDFLEVSARDAFTARIYRVAKDDPTEHGTEITIGNLRDDQWTSFDQHKTIWERLSDCYSYLLREGKLAILLNSNPILPRRPCIWDASRVVTLRGVPVAAVQEINHVLPAAWVCRQCGLQHDRLGQICTGCRATQDLAECPRRIWGWIGVQRYLHPTDFGLDFLRNGRKILCRDKSLFTWTDAGDSLTVIEYPVDAPMAGRIVGEIHCDHLPVSFLKNAFDYDSNDWQQVIQAIRGRGPLGPALRRRLGFPTNDSPLALLFNAFRRNDPGTRYLTPGNGRHAVHQKAREWADRFHNCDPAFQTDRIWYEAARSHDEINSGNRPSGRRGLSR